MAGPKKIGVLGGTFDPPHWAHLRLAAHFAKLFQLDRLLLIPSGHPWQKSTAITPPEIRYALTLAAAEALSRFFCDEGIATEIAVDRIELDRHGPTYAIDTAVELRQRYGPNARIIWLMGSDSLMRLDTWQHWPELLKNVHLAVASRPGSPLRIAASELGQFIQQHQIQHAPDIEIAPCGSIYLDNTLEIDLSSTELRERLSQHGASQQSLFTEQIPKEVLAEIANLGLYSQSR